MKHLKKIVIVIGLSIAYLQGQNQSEQQLSQEDQTALQLIGAMEESIKLSSQKKLEKITTQNVQQKNLIKNQFTQFLDQYLTQFGQVYEKQGGLMHAYQNIHYISSRDNKDQAITQNEYNLLLETLQQATNNSDWGSTINLELSVNKNDLLSQKNLKLYEIVDAIKQVPLPKNYSMTSILLGTAAIAAIAAGAYFAASSMHQNQVDQVPTNQNPAIDTLITRAPIVSTSHHITPTENIFQENSLAMNATQPKKKRLFESGLQRYVDAVAANPDLDNQLAADNQIAPDEFDAMIAHPITETMMLPFDIKNRLEITQQNLQNPDFKLGTSIDTSLEKINQLNLEEGHGYIRSDEGDQSLGNTVSNLGIARMYAPAFRGIRQTNLRVPAGSNIPTTPQPSIISHAGMLPIEAPQGQVAVKGYNGSKFAPKSDTSLIKTTEITGHAALEAPKLAPNNPSAAALPWTGPAAYSV